MANQCSLIMAYRSTQYKGPKSPLAFYIELYCKKKTKSGTDENNLVLEATKTWTTLSEEERTQFVNKYNECKRKHRHKLANHLKQTELYMKKKQNCKRISDVYQNEDLLNKLDESKMKAIDNSFSRLETIKSPIHDIDEEITSDKMYDVPLVLDSTEEVRNEAPSGPALTEPTPPIVKNSKELFDMIQARNGSNDVSWSTLSNVEKSRYRKAVCLLKKNYITNFRTYLESLSSKELFNYYVEKLDS